MDLLLNSLLSSFVIINIVLLAAGNYFYNIVMGYNVSNGRSQQLDKTESGPLDKEYVNIRSIYGYDIKGIYVKNPEITENTVILAHGIGMDKEWSIMKYSGIFLDRGYNIFAYDSRSHGGSGGDHPGYGYYEKDDLKSCISYIKARNPAGRIGIHCESLGAAGALMYAESYVEAGSDISFIIEDSGYSDLKELFIYKAGEYRVPRLLRPLVVGYLSMVCKFRSGFFLGDVSPIKGIDLISVPILFIHGACDTFTPPEMAESMFERKSGTKMLYIAKGASHAESLSIDPEKYNEVIDEFLGRIAEK